MVSNFSSSSSKIPMKSLLSVIHRSSHHQRPCWENVSCRYFSSHATGIGRNRSFFFVLRSTWDFYENNNMERNRRQLTRTTTTTTTTPITITAQQQRDEREKMQREEQRAKQDERLIVLKEAASLTKSMYRICLRSVEIIRPGNEMDDREFQQREEDFVNQAPGAMLSMSRPPNREDELESRAEYYYSFTRESFMQESDCLEDDPLRWKDIQRFLYHLKKADKDRRWLLADMMFSDPYKDALSPNRIETFEVLARRHVGEPAETQQTSRMTTAADDKSSKDEDDPFDDEMLNEPDWFKKKYPHLR